MNKNVKRVLLATGISSIDSSLQTAQDNPNYQFMDQTVLKREELIDRINSLRPDKVLIFDQLPSDLDIQLTEMFNDIINKTDFSPEDVVFVTSSYNVGDSILAEIVQMGFYNIIADGELKVDEIYDLFDTPNTIRAVIKFKPVVNVDDNQNKKLFTPPSAAAYNTPTHVVYVKKDPDDSSTEQSRKKDESKIDDMRKKLNEKKKRDDLQRKNNNDKENEKSTEVLKKVSKRFDENNEPIKKKKKNNNLTVTPVPVIIY